MKYQSPYAYKKDESILNYNIYNWLNLEIE